MILYENIYVNIKYLIRLHFLFYDLCDNSNVKKVYIRIELKLMLRNHKNCI